MFEFLKSVSEPLCTPVCPHKSLRAVPAQKIITNHFVQAEKVQNPSNRHFFKCNYCSKSVEGRSLTLLQRTVFFVTFLMRFGPHIKHQHVMYCHIQLWIAKSRAFKLRTFFESLSKLRASYANFLHKMDQEAGKLTRRKHAHMHTRPDHGLDTALSDELQRSFAWVPPLVSDSNSCTNLDDDFLAGPESITDEELLEEFNRFEYEIQESESRSALQEGTGQYADEVPDVFAGDIIDWNELEKVNKGITPAGFIEEIDVVSRGSQGEAVGWNIDALLTSEGVASMQ